MDSINQNQLEHSRSDMSRAKAVAGAKMFVGAAIGKTMDDSIEGRLQF
jgi:hypothetical protein